MSLNISGKKDKKDERKRKNKCNIICFKDLIHGTFKNIYVRLILFFIFMVISINVISHISGNELHKPEDMTQIKTENKKQLDDMDILMEKLKKEKELRESKEVKQSKEPQKISKEIREVREIRETPKVESKSIQQLYENVPNTSPKPVKKEQKMTRYEDWVDEPNDVIDSTNNLKQDEVIKKNELMIDSEKDTEVER